MDISYDAMEILCGTLGGAIGVLNVQNKEYKTILRSPPNAIKELILHPSGDYLFSIEGDNSINIKPKRFNLFRVKIHQYVSLHLRIYFSLVVFKVEF